MPSGLERPPDGLSLRELQEWISDQEAHDRPNVITMPEFTGAVDLGRMHFVYPPSAPGDVSDEYTRLWPFMWFACQHPERPADAAMLLDAKCRLCDEQEKVRGLPLPFLPPLPGDAPVMRSF